MLRTLVFATLVVLGGCQSPVKTGDELLALADSDRLPTEEELRLLWEELKRDIEQRKPDDDQQSEAGLFAGDNVQLDIQAMLRAMDEEKQKAGKEMCDFLVATRDDTRQCIREWAEKAYGENCQNEEISLFKLPKIQCDE